jgi:uncharacterized membrane protein YkvA (DUF1232 family)
MRLKICTYVHPPIVYFIKPINLIPDVSQFLHTFIAK